MRIPGLLPYWQLLLDCRSQSFYTCCVPLRQERFATSLKKLPTSITNNSMGIFQAESKKTDDVTADDTYEPPVRAASEKRSKLDLNEPEPVLEDEEVEEEETAAVDEGSVEQQQQQVEEEIPEEPFEEVKTRKRKPRKE